MNFFERQAAARRTSRRWVLLFVLAVIAIVAAVDLVVVVALGFYRQQEYTEQLGLFGSRVPLIWSTLITVSVVAIASLYKTSVLRSGGGAVAVAAGGVRVQRDTRDPLRKRLLNVVEEMSIASGVPMPEVYVLEHEVGINAFAAGHAPGNAAIAVTRGTLENLSRSELQGVIAHEFSHVLNGDMRLNIKLMGLLFGILVIALAGRTVLRITPRRTGRKSGGAIGVIVLAALLIMLIGYIGLFFGRMIQAAVARNREKLADASAVQFTRDPFGLRGALVKIGASESGSKLIETQADEIAHMLFASGMQRIFATHPPLTERIRALDPTFHEREFASVRRQLEQAKASQASPQVRDEDQVSPGHKLEGLLEGVVAAPIAIATLVANPSPKHVAAAHEIFDSLPERVIEAAASIDAARGLFFALALDDDEHTSARQLQFIATQLGGDIAATVQGWLDCARSLKPAQRQPALLRLLPELRRLSEVERTLMLSCLTGLLQREGARIAVEKYALRKLAQVHLRESLAVPSMPGRATLNMHAEQVALLFSVLAQAGTHDAMEARRAYEAGMSLLLPRERPEFAPTRNWAARLDMALNKLDRLLPAAKELLVQALLKTIAHDEKLTMQEAELLRAICACLHCPLPPLVATQPT